MVNHTQFSFSSKADVLRTLSFHDDLHIPTVHIIGVDQWMTDAEAVTHEIARVFSDEGLLAVRSSCHKEDAENASAAGAYLSVLNIPSSDRPALRRAVDQVIASYGGAMPNDQVLVQPMIRNVSVTGVIMTRVLVDGSPYFVINYDDESGKTDTITAGGGGTKTVYVFKDAKDTDFDSPRLRSFVHFARKIEQLCGRTDIDIEFCLDAHGNLCLLQVRPMCTLEHWIDNADTHVNKHIDYVVQFLDNRMRPWPGLKGSSTILGVMPDWNPAEMIGTTPRQMASSLYRELITRHVWRRARQNMGYRPMPAEELMVMIAGRPYIDVRVSFNSFLPSGLEASTCEALVGAWLERLNTNPQLHDKIEFDVAQTVLDFCFDQHLADRYPDVLSRQRKEDFRSALRNLTNRCLDLGDRGSVAAAFDAIAELRIKQARRSLHDFANAGAHILLAHINMLSAECQELGTLPFSVLARHAFMAESLLRTAVERGALRHERLVAFKKSLRTVASEMSQDFLAVFAGTAPKRTFLLKYGHLRPNSYDILSPCYAERAELFAEEAPATPGVHVAEVEPFSFSMQEQQNISLLMREAGLEGDCTSLERYIRKVIPGREYAKFVFTRNLSDMLELTAMWGAGIGLDRQTLSFLDVRDILEWASHALLRDPQEYFEELAARGRELFNLSRSVKLGYLIRSPRDVYVVPQHRSAPNFVGIRRVEAPVVRIHAHTPCSVELAGAVVCIENADPGFDWIFTRNIAGLVTMFGGTNSHMAIRCSEYGLPAAIGVGVTLFETIGQAGRCLLDAGSCSIRPL